MTFKATVWTLIRHIVILLRRHLWLRWLLVALCVPVLFFLLFVGDMIYGVNNNLRMWEEKARVGDIEAQRVLANNYSAGPYARSTFGRYGFDRDKAIYWYTIAANRGDAESAYSLGEVYEKDFEGARNADALFWYRTAAQRRFLLAAQRLSRIYTQGLLGQKKDPIQAAHWARLAAALGANGQ